MQAQVWDTGRRKVFIVPIAAMLKLDAGAFTLALYKLNPLAVVDHYLLSISWIRSCSAKWKIGGVGVLAPMKSLSMDVTAYTIIFSGSVTLFP